jgi:hypothetical protein
MVDVLVVSGYWRWSRLVMSLVTSLPTTGPCGYPRVKNIQGSHQFSRLRGQNLLILVSRPSRKHLPYKDSRQAAYLRISQERLSLHMYQSRSSYKFERLMAASISCSNYCEEADQLTKPIAASALVRPSYGCRGVSASDYPHEKICLSVQILAKLMPSCGHGSPQLPRVLGQQAPLGWINIHTSRLPEFNEYCPAASCRTNQVASPVLLLLVVLRATLYS